MDANTVNACTCEHASYSLATRAYMINLLNMKQTEINIESQNTFSFINNFVTVMKPICSIIMKLLLDSTFW